MNLVKPYKFPSMLLLLVLLACEDVIYPTLEPADPILVVDAWINNQPQTQVIMLTRSQPYFESIVPPPAAGAVVTVADGQGKVFTFMEDLATPGRYLWTPAGSDTLAVGETYALMIVIDGEVFEATSSMGRVPAVDSITFDSDTQIGTGKEIVRAEFWATDPSGIGDAYWIRTIKNGIPLLKPNEINIAFDAGFSAGSQMDGVMFIPPIRQRINSNDLDADDIPVSPIVAGDSLQVQIHSVTMEAFTFLNQVTIQTDRPGGFAELFSTSLANVSTNIKNNNSSGTDAVGFFNVSAVARGGKRYTP